MRLVPFALAALLSCASRGAKRARAPEGAELNCLKGMAEPPEVQVWRVGRLAAIAARHSRLEQCFAGTEGKSSVLLFLKSTPSGGEHAVVNATTVRDCRVTDCVDESLRGLPPPPFPSVAATEELEVSELISYDSRRAPRLEFESMTDEPLSFAGPCVGVVRRELIGGLERSDFKSAVWRARPAFAACFDAALGRHSDLHGQMLIHLQVAADGHVDSPRVTRNTVPDCAMVQCVEAAFAPVRFPAPPAGPFATEYPLVFMPRPP
jgi:hypothetical protein